MNTSAAPHKSLLDKLAGFFEDEDSLPPEQEEARQEKPPLQLNPVWYYWIFAASGFAGLIYESIWARYLKLFLGHAAYAQVLVLAIFLLGLALGAAWCARISHRLPRPLLGYVAIEIVVALAAVYFHDIFTWVQSWAVDSVLPGIASDSAAEAFKWTLAAALILPQSILLGATFPLMSAGLLRLWPEQRGHLVAALYFSNSLGAAAGVLTSGYLLIPLLGLPGTVTVAGLINTAAAAAVWALGHLFNDTGAPLAPAANSNDTAPARLKRMVLLVAFGTGLASFVYEILWIRMLSLLLGSSTHTFEIMLAAFILGLALGSLLVRKRANRGDNLLGLLGTVQVLMGIFALWSLFCFPLMYEALKIFLRDIPRDDVGYWSYTALQLLLAMGMMLPATLCAGMTLPLLTRSLMDAGGEGAVGKVYAANTLGAIVGVVLALHLLLPLAGIHLGMLMAAALDMAIGVALLVTAMRQRALFTAGVGVAALALAAVFGGISVQIAAAGVFRQQSDTLPNVVFYQDGKTASIAVTEVERENSPYTSRALKTNGKSDAAVIFGGTPGTDGYTVDDTTMVMLGLLPLLYNPDIERAMNIGFGSGTTSRTLLLSPVLQQLDNVEIEPAVLAAARTLGSRIAPVFDDPRNAVLFNDAKSVLTRTQQPYDVIISEPSNPWISGIANLFTKEFYARVRSALTDGGLFVQWLPLYETDPGSVASVAAALAEVFDNIHIYAVSDNNIFFVASAGAPLPQPSNTALHNYAALRDYVAAHDYRGTDDLTMTFLGDETTMLPYFQSFHAPANSDYFPYLEHRAARAFFNKTYYSLSRTMLLPVPVTEFLGHAPRSAEVAPRPHSLLMRKAASAHEIYVNRLAPQGFIQQRLAHLAALQCPLPLQEGMDVGPYLQGISGLVVELMPTLSKEQMTEVWELLQQDPCIQTLLQDNYTIAGNYTQFWHALSMRDGAMMAETADSLLPHADLGAESGQLLMLSAMAGHYQTGNYQRVMLLMLEFPLVIPEIHHATRMLAANAAENI